MRKLILAEIKRYNRNFRKVLEASKKADIVDECMKLSNQLREMREEREVLRGERNDLLDQLTKVAEAVKVLKNIEEVV